MLAYFLSQVAAFSQTTGAKQKAGMQFSWRRKVEWLCQVCWKELSTLNLVILEVSKRATNSDVKKSPKEDYFHQELHQITQGKNKNLQFWKWAQVFWCVVCFGPVSFVWKAHASCFTVKCRKGYNWPPFQLWSQDSSTRLPSLAWAFSSLPPAHEILNKILKGHQERESKKPGQDR